MSVVTSNAQNAMNNTTLKTINPLICDPEEGVCEVPSNSTTETPQEIAPHKKPVRVIYFTDPICSSCWGIEPQLRRLKLEYGDIVQIDYHMGGLLPDWSYNSGGISKPSDVAHHWDEVSAYYEMPIDGDVWLEDPLASSYPPSIAFKAAQIQDEHKAILFLRRIREMVFLEKKNITKWEHISKAALESGLDTMKLKADFEGKAKNDFQEDLNLAKSLGVRGFPTMFFVDENNNQIKVYGVKPYSQFEEAVKKLKVDASKKEYSRNYTDLFKKHTTLTTKEYAVLKDISFEEAEKELSDMNLKNLLVKFHTKNGNLWRLK